MDIKYTVFQTDWGFFGLLADKKGLIRTSLPLCNSIQTEKYLLVGINQHAQQVKGLYPKLQKDIIAYYKGHYVDFTKTAQSEIYFEGSVFAKSILKECSRVKFAQTLSYARLGSSAGFDRAARAVGSVLAKNPLPLIIPCHRIIRTDGRTGGFSAAAGLETKQKMLEMERSGLE